MYIYLYIYIYVLEVFKIISFLEYYIVLLSWWICTYKYYCGILIGKVNRNKKIKINVIFWQALKTTKHTVLNVLFKKLKLK